MFPFSGPQASAISQFLLWFGILPSLKLCFYILREIYNGIDFFFKINNKNVLDLKRFGTWAVVTGCTDGIGKAFAEELASKGLNIVLISRSEEKLKNTAMEIEDKFSVKTLRIQTDFKKRDYYDNIKNNLEGLDIGILVNNVGMAIPEAQNYYTLDKNLIWNEIDVNIGSVCMMTRIVLPKMIEKKKGIILSMSSISTRFTLPCMSIYAATKSFIESFTYNIIPEVKKYNITFKCLIPGTINTKMSSTYKISLGKFNMLDKIACPDPKTYVRSALYTLGGPDITTTGYWPFDLMINLISWLSWRLKGQIIYHTMIRHVKEKNV